jgi:putative transposase
MSEPPRHRKKLRRYDEPGHARFLTFSCYHRLPLLSKDRSRSWFADALSAARIKHGFELWAWVIMPEHVHLLILPRDGCRMASMLNGIKTTAGRRAIGYLRKEAPHFLSRLAQRGPNGMWYRFWQAGGGWDENITEAQRVQEVIDYIHFNPVRRGLVQRPEDWPWSSAWAWSTGIDIPIAIDRGIPTWHAFVK